MIPLPVLHVVSGVVGYRAVCTEHGVLPILWADTLGASLDAMGHAAHHHRADPPP